MVSYNNVIRLNVTEENIRQAIDKSLGQNFQRRDNLRNRHENVQFDCLVRGYIGEVSLKRWFSNYNITFIESNYMNDGMGNIDIDLLFPTSNGNISLEVKTSLVPDNCPTNGERRDIERRIDCCINHYDVKLIRRNDESIEELKSDIHIQIYYGDLRAAKDNYLSNQPLISTLNGDINAIYKLIHAQSYIDSTFFVAWIDKPTLIEQINRNPNPTWSFPGSRRVFWCCKIQNHAKKPNEIIHLLRRLNQ